MKISKDGLLVLLTYNECITFLPAAKSKGYHYGRGRAGIGLYSKSWDRQLGEWIRDSTFAVNPSILHEFGIDVTRLEVE